MPRARTSSALTLALAAGAAPAALVCLAVALMGPLACGSTASTTTYPPITGVTVRAESLTVGRGCGRASTSIFKYVAVVLGQSPTNPSSYDTVVASSVYDCFTDGQFVDLPASVAGTFSYVVQIYAYNARAYTEAGGDAKLAAIAGNVPLLKQTNPTFTTTCTADQVDQIQSLAVCKPLALGGAGVGVDTAPASVTVPLTTFATTDGGVVTCDVDFVTVRSRFGITGGSLSDITDVGCSAPGDGGLTPVTLAVSPASAPASYTVQVALVRANGTKLGETVCGAETTPGLASTATCQPIR